MKNHSETDRRWEAYDRRRKSARDKAEFRLKVLAQVHEMVDDGESITAAVEFAAVLYDTSASSIWNWSRAVKGVERRNWLPYLISSWAGGKPKQSLDRSTLEALKVEYLRPGAPSWAECFRRVKAYADTNDIAMPCPKTALRRLRHEVGFYDFFLRGEWPSRTVHSAMFSALKRYGVTLRWGDIPEWRPPLDAVGH